MTKMFDQRVVRWQKFPWAYVSFILIGYTLVGWLLFIYQAPWIIWLGTQAVTCHLAWRGSSALGLAITWVVGVVWTGTLARAWPPSIPLVNFQMLVALLLGSWILGVLLALTVAFTRQPIQTSGVSKSLSFWVLVAIAFVGLGLGSMGGIMFVAG